MSPRYRTAMDGWTWQSKPATDVECVTSIRARDSTSRPKSAGGDAVQRSSSRFLGTRFVARAESERSTHQIRLLIRSLFLFFARLSRGNSRLRGSRRVDAGGHLARALLRHLSAAEIAHLADTISRVQNDHRRVDTQSLVLPASRSSQPTQAHTRR